VLASAGTNIVVLFPIALMGGMVGLFIRPFALTMIIMTAVSLFISFTLTPILCSVMLKSASTNTNSLLARMERGWNRMFDLVVGTYRALLRSAEQHRYVAVLMLLAVLILFIHSLTLAGRAGFSFVTDPDAGEIRDQAQRCTRAEAYAEHRR